MTQQAIVIVDYSPRYGREVVAMWRESFEQAVGVIDHHSLEEQLQYLEERVIPENHVLVVLEKGGSAVIGFVLPEYEQSFWLKAKDSLSLVCDTGVTVTEKVNER